MEIKNAMEVMFVAAGHKKQDIANLLDIAPPTFTAWLSKLNQVERLIKICKACGCQLQITNNDGLTITLEETKKEQ